MSEEIIFQQIGSPVFQNKVYATREAARRAVLGDVELVQAPLSGLVYNRTFDPSLMHYDEEYQNEQACSAAFRCHLALVRDIALGEFGRDKVGVEIGCGKGYFLEMLNNAGANITGFDPSYEGSNPRVVKKYFAEDSIVKSPDYIIVRHVLEHIPTPWRFLTQLRTQCKPGTMIYIEVPCFEWIVDHRAFYDIFYEHANYFTLDVLERAFGLVSKSGHLFGGQYLFLVADLSTFETPRRYTGRQFARLDIADYLQTLLGRRSLTNGKTFIWGAGAKGITLSNIFYANAVRVDALIDINPAKQGKFAGGSGFSIIGQKDAIRLIEGADVFVMNPVYLSEIRTILSEANANLIPVA